MDIEFKLEKEIIDIVPKKVEFNFEQLKTELIENLDKYQKMVVTEDSTKGAKKDRAKLKALKDEIDGKRIAIKKKWNVPYIEFELKIKELIAMIDKPMLAIDEQIKAYDAAVKAEKQEAIIKYFNEQIGELKDFVSYEKIKDTAWMTQAFILVKIKKEISAIVDKIETDVITVKMLKTECEQQMLDIYFKTLSLKAALEEKTRWEEQAEKLRILDEKIKAEEERQRLAAIKKEEEKSEKLQQQRLNDIKKEEEAVLKEQASKAFAESSTSYPNSPTATIKPEVVEVKELILPEPAIEKPEIKQKDIRLFVTMEQFLSVKEFLVENKIRFSNVPVL